MIFKAIRYLIYSPLDLIIDDKRISNVDTHDPDIDIYDNYEVIGIRANIEYYDSFEEERIIISLKPTITSYYGSCKKDELFDATLDPLYIHIPTSARGE